MNAIARLSLPPLLPEPPLGTSPGLARAVRRFLAADRRYDEDGPEPLPAGEADGHVIYWDTALDGVAVRPVESLSDCAAKGMALAAAIRREIDGDETEDDLPPVLALALALAENLVELGRRTGA